MALRGLLVPALAVGYGAIYLWQTWGLPADAIGYPYAVLALLVALTAVEAARVLRAGVPVPAAEAEATAAASAAEPGRAGWIAGQRGPLLMAASFLYLFALPRLGYVIATAFYLALLFRLFGNRRPLLYLPAAAAIAVGTDRLLDRVLQVSTPEFAYANLPWGL